MRGRFLPRPAPLSLPRGLSGALACHFSTGCKPPIGCINLTQRCKVLLAYSADELLHVSAEGVEPEAFEGLTHLQSGTIGCVPISAVTLVRAEIVVGFLVPATVIVPTVEVPACVVCPHPLPPSHIFICSTDPAALMERSGVATGELQMIVFRLAVHRCQRHPSCGALFVGLLPCSRPLKSAIASALELIPVRRATCSHMAR